MKLTFLQYCSFVFRFLHYDQWSKLQLFHTMSLPVIYTPITKLQAPWDSQLNMGPCAPYRFDFMRCASKVGFARAKYDCKKELEDFQECVWPQKQFERTKIMEKERRRQNRDYIKPLAMDVPEKGY